MPDRYPSALQSAHLDLLSRHLDRRVNEFGGVPILRRIKERDYWYAEIAVKGRKRHRFIGPDNADLRQRIERARAAVEDVRAARAANRSLVRQLVAAGAPRLDPNTGSVLRAMATAGVFRLGGTLVGTQAYRLYALELGAKLAGLYEATEDVDIAAFAQLSPALDDQLDPSLGEAFGALGMQPAPSLDPARPTRWIARGGGPVVDFLAPSFSDDEGPIRLAAFDGWAQGLHFLNYLIAEPIPAVALYLDGVLVQIPRPERFAVHKLIVAQRRNTANRAKVRKDLAQAKGLIEVLSADRPDDLQDAYRTAMDAGPRWRAAIARSLQWRPEIKAMIPAAA